MPVRYSRARRRAVAGLLAPVAVAAFVHAAGPASASPVSGVPLSARPLTTAAALPSAASTTLISYTSNDAHGRRIVVTGTVAVPRTAPPRGGWPVISWAHGTTGFADACAPSRDTASGPDHDYLGPVTNILDTWIKRGYAVVQTDYQGLGTPGGHPYVNGLSEANTVTDIVRAARRVSPGIGRDWVVMGHSQGGQAALFTAQNARKRAPELSLKGAVSIAPGGVGLSQMAEYVRKGGPGAEAAEPFLPLIVLGAQVVEPRIDPAEIFSAAATPMVDAARTGCLAQIRAVPTIPTNDVFRADADLTALESYLAKQDPIGTTPGVPVLVAQGAADVVVAKPGTDALVKSLCGKGSDIIYRVYAGQDHRGAVPASLADAQQFATAVLSGRPPSGNC